jgi:predicted RNA binding protein YcfA (HicA-like mRNA interferase family)
MIYGMTSRELLRRLRRLGAEVVTDRGKGGHVMVRLCGRESYVPTGRHDIKTGTLAAILKQLGLRRDQV